MSFPSNENPYAEHPASPVPSYQCSSRSSSSIGSPSSTSTRSSSWLGASLLTIQTPSTPSSVDNDVESLKTHVDSARERLSSSRALTLLEKFAAGEGNSSSNVNEMKTDLDFNRERGANLKALALLNETSEAIVRESPPVAIIRERSHSAHKKLSSSGIEPPENLAESTRKPRDPTDEDVRDPETVAGMKCDHDIEREEWAKKRALWLMGFGRSIV